MRFAWVLTLVLAACGPSGLAPDWVAEVDGRKIPLAALEDSLGPDWEGASREAREEGVVRELDRLIREQVVLNRAEALDVEVAEEEVQALMQRLYGDEPVPKDPAFREEVHREMLRDRAALLELAPHLDIPESEVAVGFEELQARFVSAPQAQVRQIVVEDSAKARRLLRELREGADFEQVAREYSLGPEARDGGLIDPFARAELPQAFDRAFDLKPGELSDVIESPYGYHIFRLERLIPTPEPRLEEMREQIRAELQRERFLALRENWLRALRRKADIQVNDAALELLR